MKSLGKVTKMLTTPVPEGKELGDWIRHGIQNGIGLNQRDN